MHPECFHHFTSRSLFLQPNICWTFIHKLNAFNLNSIFPFRISVQECCVITFFLLFFRYMKFLYRYECHKLGLSSPTELSTAIEGNKREGRRTSYYGDIGQMQSPNSNGAANNGHQVSNSLHHNQSQMSPVSIVPTSTLNSVSTRLQVNGHSNHYGTNSSNTSIPTAHSLSPLVLQGTYIR